MEEKETELRSWTEKRLSQEVWNCPWYNWNCGGTNCGSREMSNYLLA
jgi:hypothetical protein